MSHRSLHLQTFEINKYSMDLENLFSLDDDIKDKAIEILDEIDDHNNDDHSRIDVVMEYIRGSHRSFSTNFTWQIDNIEYGYIVAVAYNY